MKRALLICLLLALSCTTRGRTTGAMGCSAAGSSDCRPAISAPGLDGRPLSDGAFAGKIVLVNFWATWCGPCAKELPDLERVYERHAEHGFVIVGLVSSDQAQDDDIFNFAAARGVTYPLGRATPELERSFGMGNILPMSMLYDRTGTLRARWSGSVDETELEKKVAEILRP